MSFMSGLSSATSGSGGRGNDMTGQGRMLASRMNQGEIASTTTQTGGQLAAKNAVRQSVVDIGRGITTGDPTKKGSASDQMGQLLRAEWDDYINRFAPYDQKLIGLATSDEDNQFAIDRARQGVGGAFDTAAGTMQRNRERMGVTGLADVDNSISRQMAGSRTLAELSAVNNTRLHAQDRDKSIMAGDAAAGLKSGRLTGGS